MPDAKDILEGKPLRCPLHAAVVHLPIACFALGSLLDVASWIWSRPEWMLVPSAFVSLLLGIGFALFAAVTGFVDYSEIRADHPGKKTATAHMVLNLVAVGLFALSAGLRFGAVDASRTAPLPLFVSLIGFAIIGFSGYLGGRLVYAEGIGVGRHRHVGRLPQETRTFAAGEADRIVIGRADELAEGETMRTSVDGTIVVVARHGGRCYAFQEFCTHRYGPMSEGKLERGEVVCPWHRSRFELSTGRPCGGPAKVPLNVYEIEERGSELWLRVPDRKAKR